MVFGEQINMKLFICFFLKITRESTDVYFYKDVVSVSTCSKSVKIEGHEYEHEMFKLVTAGGTVLEVSLKDVEKNSRNSINAMRQLLREKKAK